MNKKNGKDALGITLPPPRLNLSEGRNPEEMAEAEEARHARQDAALKKREGEKKTTPPSSEA